MGKRKNTANLTVTVPYDVLEAAAERANQEQRSFADVATALAAPLLRDYAAGRTWLNQPAGDDQ